MPPRRHRRVVVVPDEIYSPVPPAPVPRYVPPHALEPGWKDNVIRRQRAEIEQLKRNLVGEQRRADVFRDALIEACIAVPEVEHD